MRRKFWFGMKKRKKSQIKRQNNDKQTKKVKQVAKTERIRSSSILTKKFEISVTDFLMDPHGLPIELRDYVLVDQRKIFNHLNDPHSLNIAPVTENHVTENNMNETNRSNSQETSTEGLAKNNDRLDLVAKN